jgi:hypothetical protein
LNGSDLNNGVKVLPQDFSIMKFQTQIGSDMVVIWITKMRHYTHSLKLIKIINLSSVLIPLLQREENNLRRNGKQHANLFQNLFQKKTWFILMNKDIFLKNHISEEFGNTIENICSR